MSQAATNPPDDLLWDFRVEARRLPDGKYALRITGSVSGVVIERVGWHPLFELIRAIGEGRRAEGSTP